ncbi:MAG: hypothetical protein HYY55_00230 [Candidatus Niyogibacteria bacterium]|nr:MAG: hypothetical protein HYY55_00230 [Candidatus Niyogibacteria bacterium]
MAKEIRLEWDVSSLRVDEDEFQLVVLMLQDAGWKPHDAKAHMQTAQDLMSQGYEKSRAVMLVHMASGELQGLVRRFEN